MGKKYVDCSKNELIGYWNKIHWRKQKRIYLALGVFAGVFGNLALKTLFEFLSIQKVLNFSTKTL